ncbi:MAG TPA: ribosome-associated translation inhibitor RaiA [Thermohalobaculum sp.]|nr:ribosome-associated translation inhibitor RaiA [Thermohalobaculum sp.]
MQIKVTGKQLDVGEALAGHVEDKLGAAIGKYSDRPAEASVVFSRDAHNFRCDGSIHLADGLTAQARAVATDIYAAFEQAADRMEKQVRRHRRRLKDHHPARQKPVEIAPANAYERAGQDGDADLEEEADAGAAIVAEPVTEVPSLTVGEAGTRMEQAEAAFLVFRNTANGSVNVVYRRDDGTIGWIDPADA